MRCSLAVVVLAGCFSKPSPPCTAALRLPFDVTADDCSPWGIAGNNAVFHQGGGVLTIAPGQNSYGYCDSNAATPFGEGGLFAEIEPAMGAADATQISVGISGLSNPQLTMQDGMLTYDQHLNPNLVFARKPYVHDAMHWWRFVPDLATHAVIAQTSPDGSAWTELGRAEANDLPPADQDLVDVEFQLYVGGGNTPGHAEFRNFDSCPEN